MAETIAQRVIDDNQRSWLLCRLASTLADRGDASVLAVAKGVDGPHRAQALEVAALYQVRSGDQGASVTLEQSLAVNGSADGVAHDRAVRNIAEALARNSESDGALFAMLSISDPRERINALADNADPVIKAGRLKGALELADSVTPGLTRARARLLVGDASKDSGLMHDAFVEAEMLQDATKEVSSDWIATLCDLAVKYASRDEPFGRNLLERASLACSRISDLGARVKEEASIALAYAKCGWFTAALAAARAIENGPEFTFGTERAQTIAAIAQLLAREGRRDEALSAADEADGAAMEAVGSIASIAPVYPPEDFASENRRKIEAILAEPKYPDPESAPELSTDGLGQLNVQGIDEFLIALSNAAPALAHQSPGSAIPAIKEATRIAGWTSRTWREISQNIPNV